MQGMPKILSTKQDYLNCLTIYPEETKIELQKLLDDRFTWKNNGEIKAGECPVIDETHKVIEEEGVLNQYEYVEDEYSKIFLLGFTVKEIKDLIGEEE